MRSIALVHVIVEASEEEGLRREEGREGGREEGREGGREGGRGCLANWQKAAPEEERSEREDAN
jgi:hypothetical protein